ncbi:MAG: response regulator [Planctomycetota bacterium]
MSNSNSTLRILFVDDDPRIGASLRRSFRHYDVDFLVATHSTQGVCDAIVQRPDLIITDLQMPYISGEGLIDTLAANPMLAGTPILVVTGRWGAKLTSRMKRGGVRELLHKPFEFEDLKQAIEAIFPLERKDLSEV